VGIRVKRSGESIGGPQSFCGRIWAEISPANGKSISGTGAHVSCLRIRKDTFGARRRPKASPIGAADKIRFTSTILPKWARRTKSLDALLPILYPRGISTDDFQEALTALLGKDAPNLS
jgi:hypothetical protein